MKSQRTDFSSHGLHCAADLLQPDAAKNPPLIIMAHGFAATRDMALPRFAEQFVQAGYAVMLFDYRNFGDSEGTPRHWVDPQRHLEDWESALTHAKNLSGVNTQRIVLWGSSFSGGHVLATAAKHPELAAVISQVPHVDGLATLAANPVSQLLKLTAAGLRDAAGGVFGRPFYSPVVAHPGEVAAMTSPEAYDGYLGLLPEGSDWENKVLARVFLKISLYSPGRQARKVKAPTLVVVGKHDTVTPPEPARAVAGALPRGELLELDSNHFQPYTDPMFEQNIAAQLDFLRRHVPNGAA